MCIIDMAAHRVRTLADNRVTTIAGGDGDGRTLRFFGPTACAIDVASGHLLVTDQGNDCIRVVQTGQERAR